MAKCWGTGHQIMTTISVSHCKNYYEGQKKLCQSGIILCRNYYTLLFIEIISPFLFGSNPTAISS